MIKKLLVLASFSFAYAGGGAPEDIGNWTNSYVIKTGDIVKHTPNSVQMGWIKSGNTLNLQTKSLNGFPLKAPLVLKVQSTPTEFEQALRASGLID